jgi:hypothetical protein
MMSILTCINLVASSMITISVTGFMFLVQHEDSPVQKMSFFIRLWIRLSLIVVAAGGLFNIMNLSTPHWSVMLLNFGIGLLFTWAFFWHRLKWVDNETLNA